MCKVIQYKFACEHTYKFRRSQCNGTRAKSTRTSVKAACTAEPYIIIAFAIDCSNCQHALWDAAWKEKLRKAKEFRDRLPEKKKREEVSGAIIDAVSALVKELDEEYANAAWSIRKVFPHVQKAAVNRVKPKVLRDRISGSKRASLSLLKHEVHPEHVVLPGLQATLEDEDDGNFGVSYDPLHPIDNTNYEHPLDNIDVAQIYEEFFSEEELIGQPDDDADTGGFDASAGWDWGENEKIKSIDKNREFDEWTATTTTNQTPRDLMGWAPESETPHTKTASTITMQGLTLQDQVQDQDEVSQQEIDNVIKAFWETVNDTSCTPPPPPHPLQEESHQTVPMPETETTMNPPKTTTTTTTTIATAHPQPQPPPPPRPPPSLPPSLSATTPTPSISIFTSMAPKTLPSPSL
ncbi:hypothetical protein CC80DRAFT_488383 [Byssothecium circinans]|uniref:Uncharacterized protein n=1 Tax=Byssothecium circinans TaxID=147558 RepID=A0A6A5UCH4_9PLEO|nr:hypothetical protein CC80DRAFT_488383 [Byssothecium circinans]